MNKQDSITYLNKIRPFINLKAICDDYNSRTHLQIDYNNLRAVLNGVSNTRLSEDKLSLFINYLYDYLYIDIFEIRTEFAPSKKDFIASTVNTYAQKMADELVKELKNGFYC